MIKNIKVKTRCNRIGTVSTLNSSVLPVIFDATTDKDSTCLFSEHVKTIMFSQLDELNDRTAIVMYSDNSVKLVSNYGTIFNEYYTKNIMWFEELLTAESLQSLKAIIDGEV